MFPNEVLIDKIEKEKLVELATEANKILEKYVASAIQDKMFVKLVKQVIEDTPTVDVVEVRDCEQCIHFGKHATEYPCSHCRNCYTDKFQPNDTRTPKERDMEK